MVGSTGRGYPRLPPSFPFELTSAGIGRRCVPLNRFRGVQKCFSLALEAKRLTNVFKHAIVNHAHRLLNKLVSQGEQALKHFPLTGAVMMNGGYSGGHVILAHFGSPALGRRP
jgi:hypothetical protein